MSYDIYIVSPDGGKLETEEPHDLTGGTYMLGGTTSLWLNVTYNYAKHFYRVLGEKGIRTIYGMRCADAIPLLEAGAKQLGDDVSRDYWEPTEGNAKAALLDLIKLAKMAPEGIFDGD